MELREFKRVLQQVMALPIAALLVLAAVLSWQIRAGSSTVDQIEVSDQRIALAGLIQRLVIDEETGVRGYQITSDPRFLTPYRDAAAPMRVAIAQLRDTNSDSSQRNLQAFIEEHDAWKTTFAEPMIAAVSAGRQTTDDDLNLTGRARVESMRQRLNAIIASSESRRAQRIDLWHTQLRHTVYALALLASAIGLFLALFTRDRLEMVSHEFRRSLDLQRRRANDLFQSEQHLRTTLASIGDGVITCDAHGAVRTMNVVAEELTRWTEADARGRPLTEVFHIVNETTRAPVENPVEKVKRLNRVVGLANHTVLIRKDGAELAIDDSGAPIRNEAGELTGVVMVFRDVTLERHTRAALIANEKLAVAGRLAATIAHEIHNPLDSVANLLYLLQNGEQDAESRHFLEIAQTELARVTQISRAMLSLYRESKAPVPVDLKDMLEDLQLLMVRRFQNLGVRASSDLPAGVVVEAFPAELRQVFTNLITNAAEAAGQGGEVRVRIVPMTRGVDPSGLANGQRLPPGALVEVSDTGQGIAPEIRDRLFEPFVTTKGEQGTGLGLWVCQGIVRKHGGVIRLDSTSGGTTASVFLPSKPTIDTGEV